VWQSKEEGNSEGKDYTKIANWTRFSEKHRCIPRLVTKGVNTDNGQFNAPRN